MRKYERYVRAIKRELIRIGAVPVEVEGESKGHLTEYGLMTIYGYLYIYIPSEFRPFTILSLYTRFANPDSATAIGCNPYSGKWNFCYDCKGRDVMDFVPVIIGELERVALKKPTVESDLRDYMPLLTRMLNAQGWYTMDIRLSNNTELRDPDKCIDVPRQDWTQDLILRYLICHCGKKETERVLTSCGFPDTFIENIDTDPKRWKEEVSSGYPGYRCTKCATWVYADQQLVCECNKRGIK